MTKEESVKRQYEMQHVERCVNAESRAEYREYLNPGQNVTVEATDCISRPRSMKALSKTLDPN